MTSNFAVRRLKGRIPLGLLVVAVLTVVGIQATRAPAAQSAAGGKAPAPAAGPANPGHPITVTGTSPTNLGPGITAPVTVTVTNPNNQDIRVTSVTITVGNASAACPAAGNVTVTSYTSSTPGAVAYVAPKNGAVRVPLSITMVDRQDTGVRGTSSFVSGNQDACKHVTFPLTFTATGDQA
jgi:hypothetical protein